MTTSSLFTAEVQLVPAVPPAEPGSLYLCYYQGLSQLPSACEERHQPLDVPGGDAVRDGVVVVLGHQLVGSPEANASGTEQQVVTAGRLLHCSSWQWLLEVIFVNEYLLLVTGDYGDH